MKSISYTGIILSVIGTSLQAMQSHTNAYGLQQSKVYVSLDKTGTSSSSHTGSYGHSPVIMPTRPQPQLPQRTIIRSWACLEGVRGVVLFHNKNRSR